MTYYFDILPEELIKKLCIILKSNAELLKSLGEPYVTVVDNFVDDVYNGKVNPINIFNHSTKSLDHVLKGVIKVLDEITPENTHFSYGGVRFFLNKQGVRHDDVNDIKMSVSKYLHGNGQIFLDWHANTYAEEYEEYEEDEKYKEEYNYKRKKDDNPKYNLQYHEWVIVLLNGNNEYIYIQQEVDWTDGTTLEFYVDKSFHKLWNFDMTKENRDLILRSGGYPEFYLDAIRKEPPRMLTSDETDISVHLICDDDIFGGI